jgi:hypothetical protein
VIYKPQERGGHDPRWVVAPQEENIYIYFIGQNKLSEAILVILTLRLGKICLDLTFLGSEPTTTSF